MHGQWIGSLTSKDDSNVQSPIMLNLDDCGSTAEGVLFINFIGDPIPPGIAIPISIPQTKTNKFTVQVEKNRCFPIDPRNGLSFTWAELKSNFPEALELGESIKLSGERKGNELSISLEIDGAPRSGALKLNQRQQGNSTLVSERLSWKEFKEKVNSYDSGRYIFRGQNQTWNLRTTFHRTRRSNLYTFLSEDIATLHRHLSGQTKHVFDLKIAEQNGAFFNMLQHHGYPTPILDWSHSPYVAAFFAFRGITSGKSKDKRNQHARIFVLDKKEWTNDFNQLVLLNTSRPHFSVSEFMALNNDRLVPQQGIATIANVDDIERYINLKEKEQNKIYLRAIDIPWNARNEVMRDLSFMGITAGSLFPGIDGACEELKERFFQI